MNNSPFSMLRTTGLKAFKELWICYRKKPKYKGRYLQILFLGTLPRYQKNGFGRKIMRFLYDSLKNKKYKGLTLSTTCNKPAYKFYLKEGFSVDKIFSIGKNKYCWMHLDINKKNNKKIK
jgi:ribosomal protein S18 acetylase RimI-like enzyme